MLTYYLPACPLFHKPSDELCCLNLPLWAPAFSPTEKWSKLISVSKTIVLSPLVHFVSSFLHLMNKCSLFDNILYPASLPLRQRHTTESSWSNPTVQLTPYKPFPRLKIEHKAFLDWILIVLLFSILTACYFWQRILMLAEHHNSSSQISICQKSIIQVTAFMFRFSVNYD